MAKIRKFNESSSSNSITNQDIIDIVEAGEIDIIGCEPKDIVNYILELAEINSERFPNFLSMPLEQEDTTVSISMIADSFAVVIREGEVVAIISENDMVNPFIFNGIVICSGHDSITCYDIVRKESTKEYIR